MVYGGGGLFEFSRVLLQTIARPMSRQIIEYAKFHPSFREHCIFVGRTWNYCYVMLKKAAAMNQNNIRYTKIHQLPENEAIDIGATMLCEILVVSVPIAFVIMNLYQSKKEEMERCKETKNMENQLKKLNENFIDLQNNYNTLNNDFQQIKQLLNKTNRFNSLLNDQKNFESNENNAITIENETIKQQKNNETKTKDNLKNAKKIKKNDNNEKYENINTQNVLQM